MKYEEKIKKVCVEVQLSCKVTALSPPNHYQITRFLSAFITSLAVLKVTGEGKIVSAAIWTIGQRVTRSEGRNMEENVNGCVYGGCQDDFPMVSKGPTRYSYRERCMKFHSEYRRTGNN